jgi:hypothetical protein
MDSLGGIIGLATILSSTIGSPTKVPLARNDTTTLQQFTDNEVVRGTVVAKGAQQAVTIKTPQGNITIQTDVFLKRGAEIAFRVEQHGGEPTARIISVDGISVGKYIEQSHGIAQQAGQDKVDTTSSLLRATESSYAKTATAQISNAPANTSLPLTRGVFIILPNATNIGQLSLTPPLMHTLSQATIGTSLQIHITNIQVPTADGSGLQPLTSNAHTHNLSNSSTAGGYALTAAQKAIVAVPELQVQQANNEAAKSVLPPMPNGTAAQTQAPTMATPLGLPIASEGQPTSAIAPPTAPAPNPANKTQSNLLHGTVINNSQPRELTVQTDIGTIKLFVSTSLPKHSVVTFELINIANVRHTQQPQTEQTRTEFSALEDIAALTHTPPSAEQRIPPHIIPRTGAHLSTEMLFLMTALKGGNVRKWLGEDNIKQLDMLGKTSLMPQLIKDFNAMGTLPPEPRDNSWQHVTLPLLHDQQIHPVRLFAKGQEHESVDGNSRTTDHFLVDIDLTRLGRMQIDGLVQKQQRKVQFDAVIRTDATWDAQLQQDIRSIYERAQQISGFTGMLRFDTTIVPLPIDITPQPPSNGRSIIA